MKFWIFIFALISSFLSMVFVLSNVAPASADEGIHQIAVSVSQKQAMIAATQNQIARHQSMDRDAIVADIGIHDVRRRCQC